MYGEEMRVSLQGLPALDLLAREWTALEASADASFFVSWTWIGTWIASLPDARALRLLRVTEGARVVGLGVFGLHRGRHGGLWPARGLFLHATGDARRDELTIEYNDLLADRVRAAEVRRAVLRQLPALDAQWEELHLPGVPAGADWGAPPPGCTPGVRRQTTYEVDLDAVRARGGDYLGLLSANARAQIRRSIKAYEALGPLALEAAADAAQALEFFDAMAALHQAHWTARGAPGAFGDAYLRGFHRRLIGAHGAGGAVQLLRLRAGEQTIGYLYNLVAGGRVCNYQSGLDYAAGGKHARPGLVAHALAIEAAARAGLRVYDMMAGEHRYKQSLATAEGCMEWRVVRRDRLKFRLEDRLRAFKRRWSADPGAAVVRDAAGLAALGPGWQALEAGAPLPTGQFAFAQAAAQVFVPAGRLRVLALRRGDALAAVAPLCRGGGPVGRWQLAGAAELGEPGDALYADPAAADALAAELVRRRVPLWLERVPADSAFVAALQRALAGRGRWRLRPANPAPTIALDAQWRAPETRYNAGRRSDFRRAQRHAEKFGAVAYEVTAPAPAQLDALLDEAFAVEMKSWKGRDGSALGADPPRAAFFRAYAHAACARGQLRLAFLRIDGKAIGMQIALECGGRFWLFKIGHDEAYAKCSPGSLLMLHTLAYAARRDLRAYELLGRAEPWTAHWTADQHACVTLRTYPYGFAGAAAYAADAAGWLAACLRHGLERIDMKQAFKRARRAVADAVVRTCARAYIAGPALADARAACLRERAAGRAATVGYFNGDDEAARAIADADLATIAMLAAEGLDGYLSVKAPPLGFDADLLGEIAGAAGAARVGAHFDAHAPADADRTFAAADAAQAAGARSGCTLPGRWRRSVADAARVKPGPLRVRIVKGQWADPDWPEADLRAGYLAVVDALAGRAAPVAVATHDPVLAREALRRLQAAGTPCELELLYGLPRRAALAVARELGVQARIYVPYGTAWLPYALGHARRKPGMVWWVLRDGLQGLFGAR